MYKLNQLAIRFALIAVFVAFVGSDAATGFADEESERGAAREREELERRERAELDQRRRAELEERERAEARERNGQDRDAALEARAHLERLFDEIRKLVEAGELEEAEKLERHAREIARDLALQAEHRERVERHRPIAGELDRRMRHLHAAIENLHAGGFHEQAEHLSRMAHDLARAHEGHDHHPHEFSEDDRDPDRNRPHDHDEPGSESDLHRAVDSLHGKVERMQDEINELRGVVRRLIDAHEEERD